MADIIYNSTGNSVTLNGFRDEYREIFALKYENTIVPISEPQKWDAVQFVSKRSIENHGFNYEFLIGDAGMSLNFDYKSGLDVIKAQYDIYGADALIYFLWGIDNNGTPLYEYEGKLNLYSCKFYDTFIACDVEKKSYHDQIVARENTKLNLFDVSDLDGNTIATPVNKTSLLLHSKQLQEKFLNVVIDTTKEATSTTQGDADVYYFPECSNPSISDIKTYFPKSQSVVFEHPVETKQYLWKMYSAGSYRFQITWNFSSRIDITPRFTQAFNFGNLTITSQQVSAYLVHESDGIKSEYLLGNVFSGEKINRNETSIPPITFTGSIDQTLDAKVGDNIYIYAVHKYTYKNARELQTTVGLITNSNTSIQVDGLSSNDKSLATGLTVFEALKRSIWQITGTNCFKSDFFGDNGKGKDNFITNGFLLRRFTDKPPTITFKELKEGLDAIFCIGYEYNRDSNGENIRIERAKYFYSGGEILNIQSCYDFSREIAKEFIYSGINIGYQYYPEEGLNYLDEYCTRHEYQTPIQNHNNVYTKISNLITSGYGIEMTRREQFTTSPKDSTRFDDNCFLIAYNELINTSDSVVCSFIKISLGGITLSKFISFETLPSVIYEGASLVITGTQFNNKTINVSKVIKTTTGYNIFILETINNEQNTNALFTVSGVTGQAEKNESFDIVQNLISPDTAYNLRYSPKRMLLNHGFWISGALAYKSAIASIKNTFVKMNNALTTQFKSSETDYLGDVAKAVLREDESTTKLQLSQEGTLYVPEWIVFKCFTSRSNYNKVRRALSGKNLDGTDYGYFKVKDGNGIEYVGYPFEFARNKSNGETTIKMLRKFV